MLFFEPAALIHLFYTNPGKLFSNPTYIHRSIEEMKAHIAEDTAGLVTSSHVAQDSAPLSVKADVSEDSSRAGGTVVPLSLPIGHVQLPPAVFLVSGRCS